MMQPVTYPENKDSGRGNIVIYQAGNTSPELEVRLEDESLWLSLNQLSDLFGRDKSLLSRHLRNIYESCELDRKTTVAFFATVQKEGGRQIERQIEYFNLDAIISVGYRVNSKQGTLFRIWATGVLRNHIIRGYTANEKRLTELQQSLTIARNILERYDVTSDDAAALLLKKKPLICFISLSRTTASLMATNALLRLSFSGSWRKTGCSILIPEQKK